MASLKKKYAGENFIRYGGGVLDAASCEGGEPNHAILIVGYGVSEEGMPYWKLQNSYSSESVSCRLAEMSRAVL